MPLLTSVGHTVVEVSPKTTWVFVEVRLDDGAEGIGELLNYGSTPALIHQIADVAAAVADLGPMSVGGALRLVRAGPKSTARKIVFDALEHALLDASARSAGVPLAAWLGGPYRDSVPAYANINRGTLDRSPAAFAERARLAVTEGYRAVKLAPFDGYDRRDADFGDRSPVEAGIARVAAVREAVGTDVDIMVDCHWRFDPVTAGFMVRELSTVRPYWIEDPLRFDTYDASTHRSLRNLANGFGIRLAGGEDIVDLAHASRELDAAAFDLILPDLRTTGILEGMAVLRLAVSRGTAASLHNPAGPVLDAISRHVAAAMPDFLVLERQFRESDIYDRIGGPAAPVKDGTVGIGLDATGHGFAFDRATLPEPGATTSG